MRLKTLFSALFLGLALTGQAQNASDPTIMTINGQPVSRSEFEYSYNKNNSEGVIDKKTIDEYVDLFINYKLKVQAALDARLDTLPSFKKEFLGYRDQQIRPAMINDADVEAEARRIYKETQERIDGNGGILKVAHILIRTPQKASAEQAAKDSVKADSIYKAITAGANFAELAAKHSDDKNSAVKGGELPWVTKGQTVQQFENVAFAMEKGKVSAPVKSPFGWHIIRLDDKRNFHPYDSLRNDIYKFIEMRGLREKIINDKLDTLAKQQNTTPAAILDNKLKEMEAEDPSLANLVKEYHDGLLLFEISNRTIWEKAAKDEEGLKTYFKKHRKNYKWEKPRFKGMAYHVKDQADVAAVRNCVKGVPFAEWADKLRKTFNNDSTIRIRVEKGIFKEGDNPLIDREAFKKDVTVKELKGYPIDATYGKVIKAPEELEDVRGQVTSDYQNMLEEQWVKDLRKKYEVVVNRDILATVNKH